MHSGLKFKEMLDLPERGACVSVAENGRRHG